MSGPRIPRLPEGNAGSNDGTLPPFEPASYEIGYLDGWRTGVAQALLMGIALGGALVGVALQLGLIVGA
jgi:hypothetical protein